MSHLGNRTRHYNIQQLHTHAQLCMPDKPYSIMSQAVDSWMSAVPASALLLSYTTSAWQHPHLAADMGESAKYDALLLW